MPDGADSVERALRAALEAGARLVVTTGGTGLGPRDETPEGTARVLEREIPGIAEELRRRGARRDTGRDALSRPRGSVPGQAGALIVNLPGSPKAVASGIPVVALGRRPRARPARGRGPHVSAVRLAAHQRGAARCRGASRRRRRRVGRCARRRSSDACAITIRMPRPPSSRWSTPRIPTPRRRCERIAEAAIGATRRDRRGQPPDRPARGRRCRRRDRRRVAAPGRGVRGVPRGHRDDQDATCRSGSVRSRPTARPRGRASAGSSRSFTWRVLSRWRARERQRSVR